MEVPPAKRPRRNSFSVILSGLDPDSGDPSTQIPQVNSYLDSFPSINSILSSQYDDSSAHQSLGFDGLDSYQPQPIAHHGGGEPGGQPRHAQPGGQHGGQHGQHAGQPAGQLGGHAVSHDHRGQGPYADTVPGPSNTSMATSLFDPSADGAAGIPHQQSHHQQQPHQQQPMLSDMGMGGLASIYANAAVNTPTGVGNVNLNIPQVIVTPAPPVDWKTSFEPERARVVQRLQLVLKEYSAVAIGAWDPAHFAKQIEQAAFDNADTKPAYPKLLAIQCYKLRKLAKGEIKAPVSGSVTPHNEVDPSATTLPAPAFSSDQGLAPPLGADRGRLPSLPFLGDLPVSDLLSWQPEAP